MKYITITLINILVFLTPSILLADRGDLYSCTSNLTKQILSPGGYVLDYLKSPGEKKTFAFKWEENGQIIFQEDNPMSYFNREKYTITSTFVDTFTAKFPGGLMLLFEDTFFKYGAVNRSTTVLIEAECYNIKIPEKY